MASCGDLNADVDGCSADGTATTAISNPHISQVRIPKRNDGQWMAYGSLIGVLLGMLTNRSDLRKARNAQREWEDINAKLHKQGKKHFIDRPKKLERCDNKLWEKLCDYAMCGYQPDYNGILRRARADAAEITEAQIKSATRLASRYNTGLNADVIQSLRREEILATVGATATAREEERKETFSINWTMLKEASSLVEEAYNNRVKLGADLISSAATNYASLADSLRVMAHENGDDMVSLATMIVTVLAVIFNLNDPDDECGDSGVGISFG